MTASIDTDVHDLGRQQPEWQPWLAVVQEVLNEAADAQWDAVYPGPRRAAGKQGAASRRRIDRARSQFAAPLDATADSTPPAASGTEKMATLKDVLQETTDDLFSCSKLRFAWMKAR